MNQVLANPSDGSCTILLSESFFYKPFVHSLLPVFNTLLDVLEGGGASSTARLAIGQAVAVLFELGRDVDSDLLESTESSETYSLIEQLATESNRYTARKERNQLRAHFRDVLQTLNVIPQ